MRVIHYIPSLDRTSGGTTAYMQLLTKELGRLVELYVVSHTSENPVIEMIGSGSSFGILISTRLNSNAAIVGMDGERQCHNLEENPMTVEEFDKY